MKTKKMILLDAKKQTIEVVEVKPELEEYYRLLHCDYVEMPERYIGGKLYNIICDEEGALCSDPVISAVDSWDDIMLVGSLLISNLTKDYSDVESLTDEDVTNIMDYVRKVATHRHPEGLIVVEMSYE